MAVQTIDDTFADAWDAFVLESEAATFYHQYRWRRAIDSAYGLDTQYLADIQDGTVHGVLPLVNFRGVGNSRTLLSLPFSNYAGLLASSEATRDRLIEAARARLQEGNLALLELKQDQRCDHPDLVEKLDYVALDMNVARPTDEIWKQSLNAKVRNQVRKAQKAGLSTEIAPELWEEFVPVYQRNQRDLGTPTHSRKWYHTLADLFNDNMTVIIVRKDGKAIAGAWLFFFRDIAILQYAASIRDYLALCPNNLVYWASIEHTSERGSRSLDFARSRVDSGTYHFKQQWGGVPRQTYYQYLLNTAEKPPDVDPGNPKYKMIIATWKRLPMFVANAIGPKLRSRIPT